MTKLYTVTFEVEYVIAVEDGVDPLVVARDTVNEALHDYNVESHHMYICDMNSLPDGWDDECYPYAIGPLNRNIKQIKEEQNTASD